ncbi:GNAT family N-acetyltransferase [Marinitenerispora sediminis]|uniref:GNAT family N-acetyltransferase n=1 Tax=Marinitenerispora sediminis TaxID=1931232 RepID=A0A368T4D3_9ACTN|nr:N-acetyltransferase [Marinitenerispora sediminis]RCV57589.1 GNAT family N-acetyltransferase [Marinitenerispora sediminis]RCV58304.1 GNAT family N-acetyltransferase [Marinitenerispora sediminis]RCV59664.1 GNAT family N-acetyltransferase [Marinitenerispora sediminis]
MIEVVPAARLGEGYRRRITEVFVGGFGPDFASLSKDPRRLADAFEHMLVLDTFHVGLVDGRPAGIAALTDGVRPSTRHSAAELRRHLGLVRGTIADLAFRSEFQGGVPGIRPGAASIEFVATSPDYQGRGVATAVLDHLLALPGYTEYVLADVADTNTAALSLYRKLGFTEYRRRRVRHTRWTGIRYYVSLRLVRG